MRRRGNKSSKVPNVKLHPADKGAYSRPVAESCWAQDTQAGSDDSLAVYDLCPRPFRGVAICATGVADKPTLFKQAVELGATCAPAFTDRVTHLVAVDHGGAKYMCALERKIPIIKPSWITENYQIWLRGDDVDVAKSVHHHRLPVFSGVVVCPSGITDITRRTQISKLVTANDGTYLKNLERPVRVTHLLCSGDEETDKMRYAEKFNSRGEAKIHLVWEEWFWDSLEFGGRFDETTYQVHQPRPERKTLPVGAHNTSPPPSSDAASQLDENPSSAPKNPSRDSQQNDADDGEEEPAFVNVLPDVTLQLWGGLLGRRGYQITDGEVILSPSKGQAHGKGPTPKEMPPSPVRQEFGAARSVISSFRRANSFAPAVVSKGNTGVRQLPFRRAATSTAALAGVNAQAGPSKTAIAQAQLRIDNQPPISKDAPAVFNDSALPKQIFAGKRVRALGEAKGAIVRNAVEKVGGVMSTDEDEEVDFIIVRLVSGSKIYREEEDEVSRSKYRTECWLEQCIFEDRICNPEEQIPFIPLAIQTPIPGAEKVILGLSGFDQSESHGLKRLLRALGVSLAQTFSRRSTHLLCPSGIGLKFDKARDWNIPVVNLQWLAEVASTGTIPPVHGYLVPGSFVPPVAGGQEMEIPRETKIMDKGKGRAMSDDLGNKMDLIEENGIVDITNNSPVDNQPRPVGGPLVKNAKTIQREPTAIIPDPEPPEGQMSGVLNRNSSMSSSYLAHPSSVLTPSRSPTNPLIEESAKSRQASFTISYTSALHRSRTHILPQDESERTDPNFRIPSSKSPSPMKIQRTNSRVSLSPVKIDHEATKALQESITSLLGKRPSAEANDANAAGRNGKRARPQRAKPPSKAQSRQASDARIAATSTSKGQSKPVADHQSAFGGSDISAFESYPSELRMGNEKSQEESMRVMYEDPGQLEEKKRLMNLLKSQAGEDESISTPNASYDYDRKTRRSTRIAGF